jgi:hypothetical protein
MRYLSTVLILLVGMIPAAVAASDRPVVVELFTSQGCSSCPPADRFLDELVEMDGVIGLSWHVDYWDYIGWKDVFADPEFTERQKYYAHSMGEKMVYTPQMIVGGVAHVVGSDRQKVTALIDAAQAEDSVVDLSVVRSDDNISISAEVVGDPTGRMNVYVVYYIPKASVDITRGENAGSMFTYTNVVESWEKLRGWNGRRKLSLDVSVASERSAVIMIQAENYGPILAAADLK